MKKRLKTPHGLTLDTLAEFMESRFELVEARIDHRFGAVRQEIGDVSSQIGGLELQIAMQGSRMSKMEGTMLDLVEETTAINLALEHDAKRYFGHEKRIARLEKARA